MKDNISLKRTTLFVLICVLFIGFPSAQATPKSSAAKINSDAFVYIMNLGIEGNMFHYSGLRNGFVVGDGQYILTAAHCVTDFESTNHILRQPMIISPYFGDIVEAEIVALDDAKDIAILKAKWDSHPALELETSENWKKSKTLTVVGYPPKDTERGGNGARHSQQVLSEDVPLKYTSGKNAHEVVVGPCNYPGVGWSGSPFINPNTGKVVGVFCRGDTYHSKKYIFFKKKEKLYSGSNVNSIRQLFNNHNLDYKTPKSPMSDLQQRHRFEQILSMLDTFNPNNKQEVDKSLMHLCTELPDSYLVSTLAGPVFNHPNNLSQFDEAIKIAPESSYVHAAYGNYLLSANLPQKAIEQFEIVAERDPNHIFACHGLLSALVKTDPNAAEILGKELIHRWPDNAGFHFEYSKALHANNKRKQELQVIQKAIELCDKNEVPFAYRRYLADSLTANKQYEKAEQTYKELLETHECENCWWAYTSLMLDMGPEKIKEAKKARDKTMTFIQDPNEVSNKQHIYEVKLEKMLSDPNTEEK